MNVPKAYLPIVEAHKNDPFTQKEKEWQLMRRGCLSLLAVGCRVQLRVILVRQVEGMWSSTWSMTAAPSLD